LRILPVYLTIPTIHPNLYCISNVTNDTFPARLDLLSEKLDRRGAFLIDDSNALYMWIGKLIPPEFIQELFNVPSIDALDVRQARIIGKGPTAQRILSLLNTIRMRYPLYQKLYITKEGDPSEFKFFSFMIEDRNRNQQTSYYDFLVTLQTEVTNKANTLKKINF